MPPTPRLLDLVLTLGVPLCLAACTSPPETATGTLPDRDAPPAETRGAAAPSPIDVEEEAEEQEWAEAVHGLDFSTGRVVVEKPPARVDLAAAQASISLGLDHMNFNRRTRAVKAFAAAVMADPEDAASYRLLARAMIAKGKVDLAIASYRTALDLEPNDVPTRVDLAKTIAREGRFDDAIAEMQDALALDPAYGPAHERLAIWEYYGGRYDVAWEHVRAAEAAGYPVPPQLLDLLSAKK